MGESEQQSSAESGERSVDMDCTVHCYCGEGWRRVAKGGEGWCVYVLHWRVGLLVGMGVGAGQLA